MVRAYQEAGPREIYREETPITELPSAAPEFPRQAPVYLPDRIRQRDIEAIKKARAEFIAENPSYAYLATEDENGVLRDPARNMLIPNGGSGYTLVGGPPEELPLYITPPKRS